MSISSGLAVAGTESSETASVTTSHEPPVVETGDAVEITDWSATLQGELTELESGENATVWFEYSRLPNGTVKSTKEVTLTSQGKFNIQITNLSAETRYVFQARAKTTGGSDSGEQSSFTTAEDSVSASNSITRSGHRLIVSVEREDLDGAVDKSVWVTVMDTSISLSQMGGNSSHVTYGTSIPDLDVHTPLETARVSVSTPDGQFNVTLDLRYLAFGDKAGVSFGPDGRLRIPIRRVTGLGESVTVLVGSEPVSASVHADRSQLVIDREQLAQHGGLLGTTSFELPPEDQHISPSGNDKSIDDVELTGELTIRKPGEPPGRLTLDHPLFFDGLVYQFEVSTNNPSGRYIGQAEASGSRLTIDNRDLPTERITRIRIWYEGLSVLSHRSRADTDFGAPSAQVVEDSRNPSNLSQIVEFQFPAGAPPVSYSAIWIWGKLSGNDTYIHLNASEFQVYAEGNRINITHEYLLKVNGTYRFILQSKDGSLVAAASEGNTLTGSKLSAIQTASNATDQGGIIPSSLIFWLMMFFVFLALVVIVLLYLLYRPRGGGKSQVPTATTPDVRHEVSVKFRDSETDRPVALSGELSWEPTTGSRRRPSGSNRSGNSVHVRNETSKTLELKPGGWRIKYHRPSQSDNAVINVDRDRELYFSISPVEIQLRILDEETGVPIPNANITCKLNTDETLRETSNEQGLVGFETPANAERVDLEVDHDYYDSATKSITPDSGDGVEEIYLSPRIGDVEATASINGSPLAEVPVEIRTRDQYIRSSRDIPWTRQTNEGGQVEFNGLLIGSYRVRIPPQVLGSAYSSSEVDLKVTDGSTSRIDLEARFEFELSESHRAQVREIRDQLSQLGTSRGQDIVIPRYYGSVIESLLEGIEDIDQYGHQFAQTEVEPDETAEALIGAAGELTTRISAAMSSKRNGDLFEACANLEDTRIEWGGEYSIDELVDWVGMEPAEQRRRVRKSLDRVNDQIGSEQGSLATLSPAREVTEQVAEMIREMDRKDSVRESAPLFAADELLAAIEDMFEHSEIRERMRQTVF